MCIRYLPIFSFSILFLVFYFVFTTQLDRSSPSHPKPIHVLLPQIQPEKGMHPLTKSFFYLL